MTRPGHHAYETATNARIVRVLLDHELLAEGGRASLRIADRLHTAVLHAAERTGDQTDAVAEALDTECLATAGSPETLAAAQAVVDAVWED